MRLLSFAAVASLGATLSVPSFADRLEPGPSADTFVLTAVASGLAQPTSMDWLPDGRMVVTEKGGNVVLVSAGEDGGTQKVVGTFAVDTGSEKGLLHVLVHPGFASNRLLVFYYSAADSAGGTNLDRHRVVTVPLDDQDQLDLANEVVLLRGLRGPANHDGGALAIGPDGKLYVGVGDTGCNSNTAPEPPYAPRNYFATCLTNPNGKILRINLDGTIPSDNPLVGKQVTACGDACTNATTAALGDAREEIWAWGFRNPWRFWFDPKTDHLWVGDVGEITYEEIDVIPPDGGGKHYGWPWREGGKGHDPARCTETTPNAGACVDPQYYCAHPGKAPLTDAGQLDSDCASITGGVIVDSCQFPERYRGKYFFADAGRNWVSTLTPTADRRGIHTTSREKLITVSGQPVDVAVGPDGALYYAVISGAAGSIQRLFPKAPASCPEPPEAGAPADAGVDASEPSSGGAASTGGSGNTGGRNTGGRSAGGASGAKDGGAGGSGGGETDDDGCDCRIGGGANAPRAALIALAGLAWLWRRRKPRS